MAGFKFPSWRPSRPTNTSVPPTVLQGQSIAPKPKTLAELEQEMEVEVKAVKAQVVRNVPARSLAWQAKGLMKKLIWTSVLLGIPVGAIAIANLPYPAIRRPVAEHAPILLLPSYLSMDHSFRQAIASLEEARQLINNPTSPADLEQGGKALTTAKTHLDALPLRLDYWSEDYYGWYSWRLSPIALNLSRADVGRLQAKLFQETNAQSSLVAVQQALTAAKQQFEQPGTSADRNLAIASWRGALDQLRQIPAGTLAGRTAQQLLDTESSQFEAIVGYAAENQQTSKLIEAARQFAWQAAKQGQNPPHSVAQWRVIEQLWQEAIVQLDLVSPTDAGYVAAQSLRATYRGNLGEIQVRRQEEEAAVAAFQQAQRQYQILVANAQNTDPNWNVSQIQGIIDELGKVKDGTTVYNEAQEILIYARNKLAEVQ